MNIEERVLKVISIQTQMKAGYNHSFSDLYIDYLDKLEIAISIEEEFDIALPDNKYFELNSVKGLIDLITELIY